MALFVGFWVWLEEYFFAIGLFGVGLNPLWWGPVVFAWRGPRIWLRQKHRSWDVWIASLGMGMLIMWGLARTAAGNVGVRRRIWRLHLRMRLSSISSCLGVGGMNWLV